MQYNSELSSFVFVKCQELSFHYFSFFFLCFFFNNNNNGLFTDFVSFLEMLEHVERKLFDKSGRPVASTVTMLDGDFTMAGELMVMSILQGGPAPNFLDSSLFQFLVNQPLCPVQLPTPFKEFALKV